MSTRHDAQTKKKQLNSGEKNNKNHKNIQWLFRKNYGQY